MILRKNAESFKEKNTMNFLLAFRQYLAVFSRQSTEKTLNCVIMLRKTHFANLNALILLRDRQKAVARVDMNGMLSSFVK